MNRIASATTPEGRNDGIDIFEILLSPYLDTKYEDNMKPSFDAIMKVKGLDPSMKGREEQIQAATAAMMKAKFRELMGVAERKNLLLEKTDRDEEWNLDDSESECTENDNDMEIQD